VVKQLILHESPVFIIVNCNIFGHIKEYEHHYLKNITSYKENVYIKRWSYQMLQFLPQY